MFTSCKKDQANYDLHYDYFGLLPGRFVEYNVVEIHHDINQSVQHDTLRYQLKTLIGDTIIDNEGRVARRFIRFKRDNSSQAWTQTDTWTAIIVDRRAELVEENQRLIKLVFAPTEDKEWNVNAFNSQNELQAYYRDIHSKVLLGGQTFDSSLVVEQEDFFSLIDYRRKYETYSKNIGLISKYFKDLKIVGFDTSNVQFGTELFYNCYAFGYE
ncbi:MAG: hypothetical protein RIT43_1245 [Bacteroidota bacterium]